MAVTVLRLGHRIYRDQRITSHCALVARAFGADAFVYSGQRDREMEESVIRVVRQWGGAFSVKYIQNWKAFLQKWKGKTAHLTVYGMPLAEKTKGISKSRELVVIVGGEKVPPEVYQMADWNISVTGQPHSEIAALSIFLDRYFRGEELKKSFPGAKLRAVPQERGKKVIKL